MATTASFFLPIVKIDKTPEGHRLVTGKVSTERVDLDGQIADYAWAKKEAQAWFGIANVREQHSRNVVGKGLELDLDDTLKSVGLTAKVVDPVAITKLDEGLYTGFSFGAKNVPGNPIKVVKDAQAPGGRIVGGQWVEISLADRPANPDSMLSLAKAAAGVLEIADALGEFAESDIEKVAEPDEAKTPEAAEPKQPDADTAKQLTGDAAVHEEPLQRAQRAIRDLLTQEASETEPGKTYQLGYLVDALQSLDGFAWSEADEAYSTMVVEMAAMTDKETRRALYKDVAATLKKVVEDKAKSAAADAAKAVETEKATELPPVATTEKVVEPDTEKFLTAESIKAVLPDQLKAILPELLKEHKEVLKEVLAEAFAKKEVEADVEKLGKRAQPGGPMIGADLTGLRSVEKSHPVNQVVEPGDVPMEALAEMAKFAEYAKSDDIGLSQSARRSLAKLKVQYGIDAA